MRSCVLKVIILLACSSLGCADDGNSEVGGDTNTTGDGDTDTTGDGDTDTTGDGDTDTTGDGDGDTTGDGDGDSVGCDPWDLICEYTGGPQAQIDCGVVTPDDDLAAWEAAEQCALDALTMTAAFKVMGQSYGIDSLISRAYGALAGDGYQPLGLIHDDGGLSTANYFECVEIDSQPGCMVEVGDLCLRCVDATDPVLVCQ